MKQEVVMEINGKRYVFDEPDLEVMYNTDSLGNYAKEV